MYKLASEHFRSNLCKGLSTLQHQQQFVDVTLVTDGHLIKAHQNIIALASPYLKDILQSAKCQNPIMFFSDIDYKTLTYILEYIYNGEVDIPTYILPSFMNAAKKMHIIGIEHLIDPQIILPTNMETSETTCQNNVDTGNSYMSIEINAPVNSTSYSLENAFTDPCDSLPLEGFNTVQGADNTKNEMTDFELLLNQELNTATGTLPTEISSNLENTTNNLEDEKTSNESELLPAEENVFDHRGKTINIIEIQNIEIGKPVLCKSSRGSPQIIFNRFLYNMHHEANNGSKKRWRCIEYRRKHCQAYIDTLNDNVVSRRNDHNHLYHDEKILSHCKVNNILTNTEDDTQRKKRHRPSKVVKKSYKRS